MVNGILRFFWRELFAMLANQLVINGSRTHSHHILIIFCLLQNIGIPIRLHIADCILCRFRSELLPVFAGELIVYAVLAHMHQIGILVCFSERIQIFGRDGDMPVTSMLVVVPS